MRQIISNRCVLLKCGYFFHKPCHILATHFIAIEKKSESVNVFVKLNNLFKKIYKQRKKIVSTSFENKFGHWPENIAIHRCANETRFNPINNIK